jgi:hypothetical protein
MLASLSLSDESFPKYTAILTFTPNALSNQTSCNVRIAFGGSSLMKVQRHAYKQIQGRSAETLLLKKKNEKFWDNSQ